MHVLARWLIACAVAAAPLAIHCQEALPERPVARLPAVRFVLPASHDEPVETIPAPPAVDGKKHLLTLADLEGMALANNPTLAVAAARIEAAQGRWVQAGLRPNPVIGYHAAEIGTMSTAGQQGGFVSQRFITAGKRQLDRAVAGTDVDRAAILLDAQQRRVINDVRIRFYDALVAQRRLELAGKLAGIGDKLVDATRRLLDARQVSENTLLQAEIEAESAHIARDNAVNGHREAWRRLAAVVGVRGIKMAPLAGDLDEDPQAVPWESAYTALLAQSPELAAAHAQVQRARLALARAVRGRIPDVDVSVSVRHHNVSSDDLANVQVGIPLPVFDANQGNIRRARAEVIAAEQQVRRLELALQDRLAVVYRQYSDARQQARRYSGRILPRADKSLELVTAGYAQRQIDYLTLITTQRTFFQVSLAHLDALQALRRTAVVIEGQLLSGSLETAGGM